MPSPASTWLSAAAPSTASWAQRGREDDRHPDAGDAAPRRTPAAPGCWGTTSSTEADAVRGLVSLTGQLASVDEELTGRENLVLLGRLLGPQRAGAKARADELLEAFGIADAAGRLVKHYSGGMRRRLDIAASIVVTPRLMFLDEPTTGLDPRSRNQVWEIIRALVGGRHDDPALHPVPGGGRPARRRDRGDRPRPGHRRGHPRPAEGVGRRPGALQVRLLDPDQRPEAERRARARGRHRRPRGGPGRPVGVLRRRRRARPTRVAGSPGPASDRRLLARPAQPRRGLPGADRPSGRGRDRDAVEEQAA